MSNFSLFGFQEKAKQQIIERIAYLQYAELLKAYSQNPTDPDLRLKVHGQGNDSFRIQLDAPTGSGKTVTLGAVAKEGLKNYVHIVFTPGAGNLEEQTARSLTISLGEMNVTLVNETTFNQPAATGCTYVGNWEQFVSKDKKTNKYKNRIMRDGDTRTFLDWLDEIGEAYIPVVVTIDEAHYGSSSATNSIKSFLKDIVKTLGYSPIFLEVSATPILEGAPHIVKIDLKEVQEAGLIRKDVRLNGDDLIKSVNKLSLEQRQTTSIEPYMIDSALRLQEKLNAEYIRENILGEGLDGKDHVYHSLIGLQIPNGKIGNDTRDRVEAYLRDEHGITRENGQLFVYLSGDITEDMKDISRPDSTAKVLIYKQGIATGWDCPRAQILLGFRHITSKIFTKQNLGRFLRAVNQKHYNNDLLDYTYVISNVGDLGQASFGDDVDTDFSYQKASEYRVNEYGHLALSSFNSLALPQSHYARVNQVKVPPHEINKKWIKRANAYELWKYVSYSNSGQVSDNKLISATLGMENAEDSQNWILQQESKSLASDDAKQSRDFSAKILSVITKDGRSYGLDAQLVERLKNSIVRWYVDTIRKPEDSQRPHYGKNKGTEGILDQEKLDGSRASNLEIDYNDFAIEQLSLDATHWKHVERVLEQVLEDITPLDRTPEETFLEAGVSKTERELQDDDDFVIALNSSVWSIDSDDNRVGNDGIGLPEYYATVLSVPYDETDLTDLDDKAKVLPTRESYREGVSLSGPEISFERNAIPSLITLSGKTLASYYKAPENKSGVFRVGVEGKNGTVSDFYPDYLGEMNDLSTGEYVPFIIEVKAEEDAKKAKTDSVFYAKAACLVDLTKNYKVKAGLAYERNAGKPDSEWVVVTGFNADGTFVTSNLKGFLQK